MQQRVILKSPENTTIATLETPFYFDKMGHKIINQIGNVPLIHPGKYEFEVYVTRQGAQWPEQPSGSFPLLVIQMPTMQIGQTS